MCIGGACRSLHRLAGEVHRVRIAPLQIYKKSVKLVSISDVCLGGGGKHCLVKRLSITKGIQNMLLDS